MSSSYDSTQPVYWFISVGKIDSWPIERLQHEYADVHAKMTAAVAKNVLALEDYTQIMVEYDGESDRFVNSDESNEGWHALTIHRWSSLNALHESFGDPGYKASAGKHIFCRLDQNGCFARKHAELESPDHKDLLPYKARMLVFHRREPLWGSPSEVTDWLSHRFHKMQTWDRDGNTAGILRYRQYLDFTPQTIDHFFEGTQFADGNWQQFVAVEEFAFNEIHELSAFLKENKTWIYGSGRPMTIGGKAFKVLGVD